MAVKKKVVLFVCVFVLLIFSIIFFCPGFLGSKDSRLLFFAMHGHWSAVENLIKSGASVDVQDSFGYTPLHFACFKCDTKGVNLLLANGADANKKNNSHQSSIHIACQKGSEGIVKKLLENGGIPSVVDSYGETPLFYAVNYGYPNIVKVLLDASSDVNIQGKHGWTPLHVALRSEYIGSDSDRVEIVSLLIKNNADVNINNENWLKWETEHDSSPVGRSKTLNNKGGTPLEIAKNNDFEDIVTLLKSHGAN